MKWIKAPEGKITEHFSWDEAACHCCGNVPNVDEVIKTAEWLERVRAILGCPIRVLSWCRCSKKNAATVGAAKNSYHLKGVAVDIACKIYSPAKVQKLLAAYQGVGKLIGGMGSYLGFTHIDRRKKAAIWEE